MRLVLENTFEPTEYLKKKIEALGVYSQRMVDGPTEHARVLRGDHSQAVAAADALEGQKQTAWATLLRAEVAAARGDAIMPGALGAGEGSSRLALFYTRLAVTSLEPIPEFKTATEHPVVDPMIRAWQMLANGDAADELSHVEAAARQHGAPDLTIECAVLRALHLMMLDEADAALTHARRASRMARTESLPQSEYLAGLVLARTRRLTGLPHLALRISNSLRSLVTPHWHDWLQWEHGLAGGGDLTRPAIVAAVRARNAARSGDVAAKDAALHTAKRALSAFGAIARDVTALQAVLGVDATSAAREQRGLETFAGEAYVWCRVGLPAQVVRAVSLPANTSVLPDLGLKGRRIATLISALALAGGERAVAECFEDVFGFEFIPGAHQGTLDVLLHRARAALADLAELHRDGESIRLSARKAFVVLDPRSRESNDAKILRAIAHAGGAARAKKVASETGLSVRQSQRLLKELAARGSCDVEKRGRELVYCVEDTTFSEPTQY